MKTEGTFTGETHTLRIAGLTRQLPRVRIKPNLEIASFVMLGDTELVENIAMALYEPPRYPRYRIDVLVCPEAKAIPLTHVLAALTEVNYVVVRKSVKSYMHNPVVETVKTITTEGEQTLVIDGPDAEILKGRNVCIVDDVVSTGGSVKALASLLEQVGCRVISTVTALLEDGGYEDEELVYLERLPVFPVRE